MVTLKILLLSGSEILIPPQTGSFGCYYWRISVSQHHRAKNLTKQNTFPINEGLILSGPTLTCKEQQCNESLSFVSLDTGR